MPGRRPVERPPRPRACRPGELNQQLEEWFAERIAATLSACLRGPGSRAEVDVEVTARMLNLLFWRLTETRPEDPDRVARALNHLLRHALFSSILR